MKAIYALLTTLEVACEKTGLMASIRNQCQRLVCLLNSDRVSKDLIKPGTPLLVDLFGLVEHSGIYLGNGFVAELYGDNLLRAVSLKEFIGDSWRRTGRSIYAACSRASGIPVSSKNAALNACAYIKGKRTVEYDLFRNNCHLFSISCVSGHFQEKRDIGETFANGGISIGVLTTAISYFLNKNNIVVWKPVAGWERKNLGENVNDEETTSTVEPPKDTDSHIEVLLKTYGKETSDLSETRCDKKIQETRRDKHKGVFEPCIPLFKATWKAVKDKELHIPKKLVGLLSVCIGYFFFPIDAIPDFIPVFGFGDDAFVILFAVKKLLSYVPVSDECILDIMRTDPGFEWVHAIGNPECIRTTEYSEANPSRNFKIPVKLLSYFINRFNLQEPRTSFSNIVPDPTDLDTTEAELKYGWKKVKVPGNWLKSDYYLINDPFGNTWIKHNNESEIKLIYAEFIKWYDTKLLPSILDEPTHVT